MRKPGEWWDKSWPVVTGCTPAGAGCDHCWARGMAKRFPTLHMPGCHLETASGARMESFAHVVCHPELLDEPLRRRKPTVYAVSLLGDLFHEQMPDGFIVDVLGVAYACAVLGNKGHRFAVLTKRPERAARLISSLSAGALCACADRYVAMDDDATCFSEYRQHQEGWPTPNIILMASVWDQASADAACAALSQLRGVRWGLHCEPMIGAIDMRKAQPQTNAQLPCWIVVGGENGPGARPMDPRWVSALRYQCSDAGVPFWFKGWGTAKDRLLPGGGDMMATDFAQEVPW